MIPSQPTLQVVVLISGRGSNLRALLDASQHADSRFQIAAVISNRPQAAGLDFTREAGIETAIVDHTLFSGRVPFDRQLAQTIDRFRPDIVVLAGFMRILSEEFVDHYRNRLLNIHPSLLPRFKGLETHQRALTAGVTEHGATVHYVTTDLDSGPRLMQAKIAVMAGDDADRLAARVLQQEHQLYPAALELIASGRIDCRDNALFLDGNRLDEPLQLTPSC